MCLGKVNRLSVDSETVAVYNSFSDSTSAEKQLHGVVFPFCHSSCQELLLQRYLFRKNMI